jgi:hypothetical protein
MTPKATEKIVSVAIKYKGEIYVQPRPCRHHHVIHAIGEKNGIDFNGSDMQGFLTTTGQFVDRVEGLKIALAANQVLDPSNIRAGRLFSEDLW